MLCVVCCVLCVVHCAWWCLVCCVCWCWCWCALRGVCGVCAWCVWRGWARGEPPVCRFKTFPCVGSSRSRLYWHNARMCSTCTRFARTHGGLFESTYGDVLNLHTGDLSLSSPSLFLSSFLLSLFLRSLPSYFTRSLSLLSSLSCLLSQQQ